jgi:hypothetical protein
VLLYLLISKVISEETTHESVGLAAEGQELKVAWVGIDIQHRLNLAAFEDGKLIKKQVFTSPYTDDLTIHLSHRPSLHLHPFHTSNLRVHRQGNSGVRYAGNYFSVAVNYTYVFPILLEICIGYQSQHCSSR